MNNCYAECLKLHCLYTISKPIFSPKDQKVPIQVQTDNRRVSVRWDEFHHPHEDTQYEVHLVETDGTRLSSDLVNSDTRTYSFTNQNLIVFKVGSNTNSISRSAS